MDSLGALERELRSKAATMVHLGKPSPTVAESLDLVRRAIQTCDQEGGSAAPALASLRQDGVISIHALPASPFCIGRSEDRDLVLPQRSVSGRHCRLFRREGQWMVEDEGSKNGVFLRGRQVDSSPLRDGDVVQLGEARLVFLAKQEADASSEDA